MAVRYAKAVSIEHYTALQLLLCHALILTLALLSGAPALPLFGACLLSFLLLLNIPYNLRQLENKLDCLAQAVPVEPASHHLTWPFTPLHERIDALAQQMGQQGQMIQSNLVYREQLFQQVGQTAAQEERNRLARDLHDSIKQQIFSITVSAAAIKARWEHDRDSIRKIVDDIERVALEAQVEMQALLQQLRPVALENIGLVESLRMQCQALGYRTGAAVTAELSDLPGEELLPAGTPEMIFRIVQEGFSNIARHARASNVWLSLRKQRDVLLLEIGDDGQGFDLTQEYKPAIGGMGLSNVEERIRTLGGSITLWSQIGKGTTLHLCIPLIRLQAEEQKQPERAQSVVSRRLPGLLTSGRLAIQIAAVFILLYIPSEIAAWVVGSCTLVALIHLPWVRRYKQEPQSEYYGFLSSTLLLCALWLGYLIPLSDLAPFAWMLQNLWLTVSISGIFSVGFLISAWRFIQATESEYMTHASEIAEKLRQQRQRLAVDWLVWIAGAALTLLLPGIFPDILRDPVIHAMGIVLLSCWGIALLLQSWRLLHWQRAEHQAGRYSQQPQKGEQV
ncbi:MAG TPA: sensor histidine kinase [Ktedonobacteraceae bacterium]|nr:sensor histidine kinase [Ktedonobacteraceae bacterium]